VPQSKIPPDPRRPLDCAAVEGNAGCQDGKTVTVVSS
jgi:hypothetical protein